MTDIHATRWTAPCGCDMIYEWDRDLPDDQRVHTITSIPKRCVDHPKGATVSDQAHHDKLLEEHQRWNYSLQILMDNFSALTTTDARTGNIVLKPGVSLDYIFAGSFPNRTLTLSLVGITLTTQQKTNAQTFLNNRFGVGKVTLI